QPAEPHHTPVDPISSTSQPPIPSPIPSPPHPSPPPHSPLQSPPHSPNQSPFFSPPRSYEAPLPEGNTSGSVEDIMQLKELIVLVPTLVTMINSLEKEFKDTKQTLGNDVVKLVKKVKSLEKALKRKSKNVLISELEGEESEDQGRKIQDIDDDPLVSLVRESMKEKSIDFGVSKEKSTNKGKRYRRRARSVAKNINIGLDIEEEVNTGSTKVDSGTASKMGQREGKAPMIKEDIQATHKTKEQMRQEEAGLEEAIKLQAQLDEELEANAELTKDVLGKDLPEQDFVKRMAEMVNQRKKHFAEERAKANRNKPMTQSYLKKLKKSLIRDKVAEVKEEEPVKRTGKRKKQKARKGINVDKSAQEDSKTDKEESVEAMNPTPLTTKSDSVVNWKIFQQGQRSIYQIMRANGADTVYMSFGAMIKDFTREDLIELYRLVMLKYGINRLEDAYDRVLWSDLRTMFDPPLNEDAIWSLPLQQNMVWLNLH
ncbi:hypothetical protein Tco_1136637, partial [Tanacetum coccineum]